MFDISKIRDGWTLPKRSGRKEECPQCHRHSFVRFVRIVGGVETGEKHQDARFGRCDHEQSCGYFQRPPREGARVEKHERPTPVPAPRCDFTTHPLPKEEETPDFRCLTSTERAALGWSNTLLDWLSSMTEKAAAEIDEVAIGTYGLHSLAWGSQWCAFPQMDEHGALRTMKYIAYNADGHRQHDTPAGWYHSWLQHSYRLPKGWQLRQCLFGQHLLPYFPNAPVNIVESEKTAVMMAIVEPDTLWLATGGSSTITLVEQAIALLKDRQLCFYPDVGFADKWRTALRAIDIRHGTRLATCVCDKYENRGYAGNSDIADITFT